MQISTSTNPDGTRPRRWILQALIAIHLCLLLWCTAAEAVSGPADQEGITELLLAIVLNGQTLPDAVLLQRRADGSLLADTETLRRWRLRLPEGPALPYQGQHYHRLDALSGLAYTFDERTMSLAISSPPRLFDPTLLATETPARAASATTTPGLFANYDVFGQRLAGQNSLDGLLELGLFNGWGVGVSSALARHLLDAPQLIRLETTWTVDAPTALTSLRLGDSISQPGVWGRSVRFGGIQWGTNFALHPGFIPFPTVAVKGEAVVPSTVDLYVNDVLMQRREVPPGPFEISDLPVVTGQGEVQVRIHDLLGRQQILSLPYYVSASLLRPGLQDYTYELGFIREDFGLASTRYGRAFAAGTHRVGVTERFTGELHAELLPAQQTMGLSGVWLWPPVGVFQPSLAVSHSASGVGHLVGMGVEHRGLTVSVRLATELASRAFTQLGLPPGHPAPKRRSQALVSVRVPLAGSLGLGYIHLDHHDQPDLELLTLQFSRHLSGYGVLHLSATRELRGGALSGFLTFTRPWGRRSSLSTSVTTQGATPQVAAQFQRSVPPGNGAGYRLRVVGGESTRAETGVTLQHDLGSAQLEAALLEDDIGLRLGASGGFAAVGGRTFFTRRLTDSFAVVAVPGYGGVRVYADNRLLARTDRDGYAVLPRLRPYEPNPVRLDVTDLPLDVHVETFEREAIPAFRSGVLLTFPVKPSRGGLLRVVLPDGQPLPAGAAVRVLGQAEEFPVALDGEVYVTGLASHTRLHATWRGQSCEFEVTFPDAAEPLPRLGEVLCVGMVP